METPRLSTVPFFRIPPHVTGGELELKLQEVDLGSKKLVRTALDETEAIHRQEPPRNSGAHVLEEHIYPVVMLALEYQLFQHRRGNPQFATLSPEGIVVALLHETFDKLTVDKRTFDSKYGQHIGDMVWMLGDARYVLAGAINYKEKTEMKFEALKTAPWQAQVAGLADRANNTLCFYTAPYLDDNRKPTLRMQRAVGHVVNIALPVADLVSSDFFAPMLREELAYYREKYPHVFGHLKF